MLLTGHADPGARVRLASPSGAALFARPVPDGSWRLALPAARQVRLFGLSMTQAGRAVQAEGYLAVTPAGQAAQLRAGAGALVLDPPAALRILAVDFDRKGGAVVSGIAPPGVAVTALVDGVVSGRMAAGLRGRFALPLDRPLSAGPRRVEATAGRLTTAVDIDTSPAAPPVGGPFSATLTAAGWRIDWMTPGGGMQTTLLVSGASGATSGPPASPST